MEKIKSSEIGKIIKNNILYVIIISLVLGIAGFIYSNIKAKDIYKAEAAVMISEDKGEDITYNTLMLNEKISNIYQELLDSNDLYEKVSENLKTTESSDDIKNKLETEINAQAGIITFEYKSKGKEDTGKQLQAIIEQFKLDVKEYVGKENFSYIQNVTVKEEGKLNSIKIGVFLFAFGFMLSLLFVITKEFIAGKIKDPSYFDEFDVEVLGVIDEK